MITRISVLILLILFCSQILIADGNTATFAFSIEEQSRLFIEGTSNVNSFECLCKDNFPKSIIQFHPTTNNEKTLRFYNTALKLRTQKLDCNNSRMNRDLCEALKSDQYPAIQIELLDANVLPGSFKNNEEWSMIKVSVALTITNVCKKYSLEVKAQKLGANRYRFVSYLDLLMTDFNIEPPTAMLGLIKVRDKIRINFDIYTHAEQS